MNTERGLQDPRPELNNPFKKVLHRLEDGVSFISNISNNPLATQIRSYAELSLVCLIALGSVAVEKASAQTPQLPKLSSSAQTDVVINYSALADEFTVVLPNVLPDPNSDGGTPAVVEPGFELGFKALVEEMAKQSIYVGKPLSKEQYQPNGDSLLMTEEGLLLVWRKIDNWTAATNGERTWINGPVGVQERANSDRFEWEKDTQQADGARATPTVPETTAQPIVVAVPTPTPIDSRLAPPMGETLRNFFTDTFVKVNRRQLTPEEIINIDGIGIRGKELIDQDYAKRTIKIIQGVPEYYALFKRTVKSLEMYSDAGGNGNIAINDVLGDAGHSVPSGDKILNDFICGSTAVEFIYDAKLTEIAVNGNIAGRSFKRAPQGSEMERDQQIRWNQAQKAASEAAIDFAIKAKLPEGMLGWYRGNIVRNEAILKNLLQNR